MSLRLLAFTPVTLWVEASVCPLLFPASAFLCIKLVC